MFRSLCVCVVSCVLCVVRVGRTNSLRSENLSEASREGDQDHRIGDPGQILKKHVTVQTTVHPLLCCGHTHTQTHKQGTHVNQNCSTDAHKTQTVTKSVRIYLKYGYTQAAAQYTKQKIHLELH